MLNRLPSAKGRTMFRSGGRTTIQFVVGTVFIGTITFAAYPTFRQSEERSNRVLAIRELRSIGQALESYHADYTVYPATNIYGTPGITDGFNLPGMRVLSTPVAYLDNAFISDPFPAETFTREINPTGGKVFPVPLLEYDFPEPFTPEEFRYLRYFALGPDSLETSYTSLSEDQSYVLLSAGPDLNAPDPRYLFHPLSQPWAVNENIYDPTNGTGSFGDIYRTGGVLPLPGSSSFGAVFTSELFTKGSYIGLDPGPVDPGKVAGSVLGENPADYDMNGDNKIDISDGFAE